MSTLRRHPVVRWLATGAGMILGGYAAYAGTAWYRYGRVAPAKVDEHDELLDRFMPTYEVVERHSVHVAAPAAITMAAARETALTDAPVARAIFKAREVILGARRDEQVLPPGLLDQVRALGWGILAENPDREIVVGAVTKPWEANVAFHALAPAEFATFREPGYVKIVWTIRADPIGASESIFRTETRAVATDPVARARFRRYWSLVSPGIIMIRWALLGPVKAEAERRVRGKPATPSATLRSPA